MQEKYYRLHSVPWVAATAAAGTAMAPGASMTPSTPSMPPGSRSPPVRLPAAHTDPGAASSVRNITRVAILPMFVRGEGRFLISDRNFETSYEYLFLAASQGCKQIKPSPETFKIKLLFVAYPVWSTKIKIYVLFELA